VEFHITGSVGLDATLRLGVVRAACNKEARRYCSGNRDHERRLDSLSNPMKTCRSGSPHQLTEALNATVPLCLKSSSSLHANEAVYVPLLVYV
jgi:hypothetical protein